MSVLLLAALAAGILACARGGRPTQVRGQRLAVDGSAGRDTAMGSLLLPYRQRMGTALQRSIGSCQTRLERAEPEGALGNLVADITLWAARKAGHPADFALVSNGGLRVPIEQGPITVNNIFELMPFENGVVTLAIDGKTARDLFQQIGTRPMFGLANAQASFAPGSMAVLINGSPLDSSRTYWLATNDYLAQGGDRLAMLTRAKETKAAQISLRDAIVAWIEAETAAGRPITAAVEGRVTVRK